MAPSPQPPPGALVLRTYQELDQFVGAAVRLLKCLCQTEPCKRLGWHSAATGGCQGIPTSFETTSRVAILANETAPVGGFTHPTIARGCESSP